MLIGEQMSHLLIVVTEPREYPIDSEESKGGVIIIASSMSWNKVLVSAGVQSYTGLKTARWQVGG